MFFGNRSVKEAKLLLKGAAKVLASRRDLLSPDQITGIESAMDSLRTALPSGASASIDPARQALEERCHAILPKYRHPVIREYCEVLLVAFILAAGIRAYILQPFKIPTGSMQPTLNGIIGYPTTDTGPALPIKLVEKVILGRSYLDIVAPQNLVVEDVRLLAQNFFMTRSVIQTSAGNFTAPVPPETLINYFKVSRRSYQAGEPIARGYVDTGDQVFVDKFSYHFVQPRLGDVFVFRTNGIRGIEDRYGPSQFYIKRIGALGGQTLRIDPPNLYINGALPDVPGLRRVMSLEDGYRGYSNRPASGGRFLYLGTPDATFTLPPRSYFALGDNSYNSADSREWGVVPEANLVGRGFVVYWPFTRHWGPIH